MMSQDGHPKIEAIMTHLSTTFTSILHCCWLFFLFYFKQNILDIKNSNILSHSII